MKLPRQLLLFSHPRLPSRLRPPARSLLHLPVSRPIPRPLLPSVAPAPPHPRFASTTSPSPSASASAPAPTASADALIEHLTDLYATAKDEFEIAAEETEKKSTYGPEDREAAHQAFAVLKAAYEAAVREAGGGGKEVEGRVGARIRELEAALRNMDEMAMED